MTMSGFGTCKACLCFGRVDATPLCRRCAGAPARHFDWRAFIPWSTAAAFLPLPASAGVLLTEGHDASLLSLQFGLYALLYGIGFRRALR